MDAHIEKQWQTEEYVVMLREKVMGGGQTYFQISPTGHLQGTTVTAGAPIEPLMRIPVEAAEALAIALSKIPVSSQATQLHLIDSNNVRDRLLQIVEKLTDAQIVRGEGK